MSARWLAIALVACAGTPEPRTASVDPSFVLTSTTTNKRDGSTRVVRYVGNASGEVAIEGDGASRTILRTLADGSFEVVTMSGKTKRVTFDGPGATMQVDGEPFPHQVALADDGAVSSYGKSVFRLEGGRVVDVTGEMFRSTLLVDGQQTEFQIEMRFEGNAAAARAIGSLLAYRLYAMARQSKLEALK